MALLVEQALSTIIVKCFLLTFQSSLAIQNFCDVQSGLHIEF